jgi:serine protease Do
MKTRKLLGTLSIAILGGIIAVFIYAQFFEKETKVITTTVSQPATLTSFQTGAEWYNFNFVNAAKKSVEAVVHVKTELAKQPYNPIMEFFYGDQYRDQPVIGFGSGVIISDDGYIVTNNHVIEGSDKISVVLNDKREYDAKLVGTDPSTDIALLKINVDGLQYIKWGNSDSLQVGEWVLAVGNPFNLTSTVTAGIVSAKGKNIGIIQDQYRLESYIQTDAAVNRGNSGGALVDINGNLVGITSAIISPSGGYAGISFAVPEGIARKVVKDLIQYGIVQRAILGIGIADVTAELAKEKGLDKIEGVYVTDVKSDGAAKDAGIEKGDLIISVNAVKVNSSSELQEQVSKFSPSDKVTVELKRNGKMKQFEVTLRNLQGKTSYLNTSTFDDVLGARFEEITGQEKSKLGIDNGLKVVELKAGKLRAQGVREGFIITQINNKPVGTVEDLKEILKNVKGGVYIEGIYPNGVISYYAFGMK